MVFYSGFEEEFHAPAARLHGARFIPTAPGFHTLALARNARGEWAALMVNSLFSRVDAAYDAQARGPN